MKQVMNPKIALVSEILRKVTDKGRIWKVAQITIVVEAGGDGSATCPDPQLVTDMADMHNLASVKG